MSACVLMSAAELRPTHEARVTATGYASHEELSAAHGRLFRKLKKHGCEYLAVNEWGKWGLRHLHLIVRADAGITAQQVRQWWEESQQVGMKVTSHCEPIRNVSAFVRYLFKDVKGGGNMPPKDFRGKLYTASRGFLARKLGLLWKEVRDGWDQSKATKEIVANCSSAAVFRERPVSRTKRLVKRSGQDAVGPRVLGIKVWRRSSQVQRTYPAENDAYIGELLRIEKAIHPLKTQEARPMKPRTKTHADRQLGTKYVPFLVSINSRLPSDIKPSPQNDVVYGPNDLSDPDFRHFVESIRLAGCVPSTAKVTAMGNSRSSASLSRQFGCSTKAWRPSRSRPPPL